MDLNTNSSNLLLNIMYDKEVISKLAEGYDFDEEWEEDAIDYLISQREIKWRAPRSPQRSPPRPNYDTRSITLKSFICSEREQETELETERETRIAKVQEFIKYYIDKQMYFKLLFMYLIISSITIYAIIK
jgi:hypothetical protein